MCVQWTKFSFFTCSVLGCLDTHFYLLFFYYSSNTQFFFFTISFLTISSTVLWLWCSRLDALLLFVLHINCWKELRFLLLFFSRKATNTHFWVYFRQAIICSGCNKNCRYIFFIKNDAIFLFIFSTHFTRIIKRSEKCHFRGCYKAWNARNCLLQNRLINLSVLYTNKHRILFDSWWICLMIDCYRPLILFIFVHINSFRGSVHHTYYCLLKGHDEWRIKKEMNANQIQFAALSNWFVEFLPRTLQMSYLLRQKKNGDWSIGLK